MIVVAGLLDDQVIFAGLRGHLEASQRLCVEQAAGMFASFFNK